MVYKTRGNCSNCRIFWTVDLIVAAILKLWASVYSLEPSMLWVICLHLIEDQCRVFVSWLWSMSIIIKPIYNNRSLLLAKDASINTSRLRDFRSSGTKVSPLATLSICH